MRRFSYTYLVTTYSQSVVSPWYRPSLLTSGILVLVFIFSNEACRL